MEKKDIDQYLKYSVPGDKYLKELWYSSSVRGVTKAQVGGEVVYWGKIIRIPSKIAGTEAQDEYEIDPLTLYPQIREDGEPVSGGTIERYEIWDIETGDLLIMFRIPFRPRPR